MTKTPSELDALLAALRQARIRIGPRELLRLQQVFAAQPRLGQPSRPQAGSAPGRDAHRRRLQAILRAALLTSAGDRERFDQVFDAWYGETLDELDAGRPAPAGPHRAPDRQEQPQGAGPETAPRDQPLGTRVQRPRRHWPWLLGLLTAELLLGAALRIWPPEPPAPALESTPVGRPSQADPDRAQPLPTPKTYQTLVPSLQVRPPPPDWQRWRGWPALLLALLAAVTAIWAGRRVARRPWLPASRLGPPAPGGPPRYYLPAPAGGADLLLTPAQQGRLVWGIGRFAAGEPTRRLDLPATVRATARAAGLPMPRLEVAERHRAVWLWSDTSADQAGSGRLADALAELLGRHGLRVERAEFRGLPDRLATSGGRCFGPREVEDRRAGALVCILTDGRVLLRRHRGDPAARLRIGALLRLLAHWPRLAWVDLGTGDSALAPLLSQHGLACIDPADLIGFLTSPAGAPRRRQGPGSTGRPAIQHARRERAVRLWSAACALPPAPIEETDALALRRALGLACPPWDLTLLRAAAPGPGGRLCWPREARVELLRWLAGLAGENAAESNPLYRALGYWQRRYDALLGAPDHEPSPDTAARRRLKAEAALLRLWRQPSPAIAALGDLAQGRNAELIREQLGSLTVADLPSAGDARCICLPWRWETLTPPERLTLHQLGFGCGGLATRRPRRPGRHWLGIGLCLGLAAGALVAALTRPAPPVLGRPLIVHRGADALDPRHRLAPDADGGWHLSILSPDQLAHRAGLRAGSRVEVTWHAEARPCIERLAGGAELHRCATGSVEQPPAAELGPAYRRLAVLAAGPDTPGVAELARALLAGGSAHQVLIDPGWPAERALLTGPVHRLHPEDRLLLLTPAAAAPATASETGPALPLSVPDQHRLLWLAVGDWAALAPALDGIDAGTCAPAGEPWPGLEPLAGDPSAFQLGGTGGCRPAQWTDQDSGIDYIALCGGEFWMGSPADESDRDSDEGPRHRVRVSPFALARTETTNAQYRRVHPDHEGPDELPVASVSWHDAQAFCAQVGARLPTEAEWEYAARAGTDTRWSFGDKEALLGDHAWYAGNSDGQAHPVATRAPNPWGLYDMHGNLWEWVADWYAGTYPDDPGPRVDPTGPASGSSRVLRGGAFYFRPGSLRSAYRFGDRPGSRDQYVGFRCARAPRRQP